MWTDGQFSSSGHRQRRIENFTMILRIRREFEESEWFQTVRTQNFCRHWPYGTDRNVSRRTAHYGRINRGRYSFQDHCIDDGHRLVWLASTGYAALRFLGARPETFSSILWSSIWSDVLFNSLQLSGAWSNTFSSEKNETFVKTAIIAFITSESDKLVGGFNLKGKSSIRNLSFKDLKV